MSYPTLALGLVALAAAVRLLAAVVARRRGRPIGIAPTAVALAVLLVMTAAFDNVMLAVGVDDFARAHASGLHLGRAPLEDFSYPLATALLLPGVWELTRRRKHAEHDAGHDDVHHAWRGASRGG